MTKSSAFCFLSWGVGSPTDFVLPTLPFELKLRAGCYPWRPDNEPDGVNRPALKEPESWLLYGRAPGSLGFPPGFVSIGSGAFYGPTCFSKSFISGVRFHSFSHISSNPSCNLATHAPWTKFISSSTSNFNSNLVGTLFLNYIISPLLAIFCNLNSLSSAFIIICFFIKNELIGFLFILFFSIFLKFE